MFCELFVGIGEKFFYIWIRFDFVLIICLFCFFGIFGFLDVYELIVFYFFEFV